MSRSEATTIRSLNEDVAVVATTVATDRRRFSAPPNARVEQFLAHGQIVARASCVICLGGQGTTQRSPAAGIPVCVVPFCRDQFDVARRVEHAEAGTKLHRRRLNPARLRVAVREAIARRPGAERVAAAFVKAGGSASAADVVEELLCDGDPGRRRVSIGRSVPG